MNIFRTPVDFPASKQKIGYENRIMLIGSCFSEYIGEKLVNFKFRIDNNPFGILYNPLSVNKVLSRLIERECYKDLELFEYDGLWHSFDHHSRFSNSDRALALQEINDRFTYSADFLAKTDFLFITFGTAFVYQGKSDDIVVANCHKMPSSYFKRRRITPEEISSVYSRLLARLFQLRPSLHIVFTVSPVRHWKDGAHENQLSKSILLLAIDQLCKDERVHYFPSYELIMDDLRDYRFYEEDMLHPNKIAIHYIWQRFCECFVDPAVMPVMTEIEKIAKAFQHRPFNPASDSFKEFALRYVRIISELHEKHPIDLSKEELYFKSFL